MSVIEPPLYACVFTELRSFREFTFFVGSLFFSHYMQYWPPQKNPVNQKFNYHDLFYNDSILQFCLLQRPPMASYYSIRGGALFTL